MVRTELVWKHHRDLWAGLQVESVLIKYHRHLDLTILSALSRCSSVQHS